MGSDDIPGGHLCPYACSRCDITCPCTCAPILVQEFNDSGCLTYRDEVCAYDLAVRIIPQATD